MATSTFIHLLLSLLAVFNCLHAGDTSEELAVHFLRPPSGSGGHMHVHGVSCSSWRLGVEANNVRGWLTVPETCEGYVGNYMLGHHYRKDSAVVVAEAVKYAKGIKVADESKDVWVFDIDETSLSNLPYYAHHGFGAQPFNLTAFNAWVANGKAPALPETLKLYRRLRSLGCKIIFLTGRSENTRNITAINLRKVGFPTWEKLLLREEGNKESALLFKSRVRKELVGEGYRIVGNVGDQWSDILGWPEGDRTFKLPDPMYYIS